MTTWRALDLVGLLLIVVGSILVHEFRGRWYVWLAAVAVILGFVALRRRIARRTAP